MGQRGGALTSMATGSPPPPKLVIFDCDGVLVDSEPIAAATLATELTRLGLPITAEACLDRYTGLSMASMLRKIEDGWGKRLPPDFRDRLEQLDHAAFKRALKPIAGIDHVLDRLEARGVATCVASSGSLEKLDLTLSASGLIGYFAPPRGAAPQNAPPRGASRVFSAEQVAHGKPAPDLFVFAAARMGAPAEECIVVEDSIAGVSAALAARMRVIGFAGGGHCRDGHRDRLQRAGAPRVAADADELLGLLNCS